jgi:hypothetical protein
MTSPPSDKTKVKEKVLDQDVDPSIKNKFEKFKKSGKKKGEEAEIHDAKDESETQSVMSSRSSVLSASS